MNELKKTISDISNGIVQNINLNEYEKEIRLLLDLAMRVSNSNSRLMVSSRILEITLPDGKWKALVYKDDTKEQNEWISMQHFKQAYDLVTRILNAEMPATLREPIMTIDDFTNLPDMPYQVECAKRKGYNQAIDDFTLYLIKKCEELAKIIYEHLNTHGYDLQPIKSREELAHAIQFHLLEEVKNEKKI